MNKEPLTVSVGGKLIMSKALMHYGNNMQIVKAMEEMAELTKELAKYLASGDGDLIKNIQEECADVFIMVNQMAMHFGETEVKKQVDKKLMRLDRRMIECKD